MTDTVPATEVRREGKAKSGYARIRARHHGLIAVHEALQQSYQDLATYSETLAAEVKHKADELEALRSMYTALQSDVEAVLSENAKLIEALAVMRSNTMPQPQPAYPPQPPYQPQPRPALPPGLPSLFSRGLR